MFFISLFVVSLLFSCAEADIVKMLIANIAIIFFIIFSVLIFLFFFVIFCSDFKFLSQ